MTQRAQPELTGPHPCPSCGAKFRKRRYWWQFNTAVAKCGATAEYAWRSFLVVGCRSISVIDDHDRDVQPTRIGGSEA